MTLKQVEPVYEDNMSANLTGNEKFVIELKTRAGWGVLTEPEARALLEWLKGVCE